MTATCSKYSAKGFRAEVRVGLSGFDTALIFGFKLQRSCIMSEKERILKELKESFAPIGCDHAADIGRVLLLPVVVQGGSPI